MSKGTPTEAAGGRDGRARVWVADRANGEVGVEDTTPTPNLLRRLRFRLKQLPTPRTSRRVAPSHGTSISKASRPPRGQQNRRCRIDHIVYQNSGDLWCLILRNKADVISVPDFFLGTFGLLCASIGHVVGSSQTVKYSTLGPGLTRSTRRFQKGKLSDNRTRKDVRSHVQGLRSGCG
jgi:hypothetical protein